MSDTVPRILLPLDGSRLAEAAIPAAAELALGWGAEILLLHLLERRAPETIHGEPHLGEPRQARSYLSSVASGLRDAGIPVETLVPETEEADLAQGLARQAEELRADLLVLCAHGSGGMRDFLLGTIAQQTLKRCVRPVLLVRPPVPEAGWRLGEGPWIVAVEPSEHGPAAIPLVRVLCKALGAPVHLVTVIPTQKTLPVDQWAAGTLAPRTVSWVLDLEQRDALHYLETLADDLKRVGVDAGVSLSRGEAVAEVLRILGERSGAVLVVATHMKAGIAGVLSGSFSVGAAARTASPILFVPAESPE